ncbi:MAG: vitamin B12-dependent ribonucleotide reductase [Armatimonadetes bacterium]|nr:vitamin B12-dependent ribonucleotide reductase [Armatimonadota bacterium]
MPLPAQDIQLTDNALKVLQRRYLKKDQDGQPAEQPEDMFRRVADNIASAEPQYGASAAQVQECAQEFYDLMTSLRFMPNSPTLMNAGREFQQLSACFVLPIEDSMESIFEAVKSTALIHKSGGGTGFSFSRLRPADDVVSSTQGVSSGPVSFMNVFDAATEAIKQGGTRRGANMAILRIDHPDILAFIEAKRDKSKLQNFNLSVGATEEFMRAVRENREYDLINPRNHAAASRLNAREVFDRIVQLAWEGGDPGVIFLDRINAGNPTPALGEIESTNPCGEQPLLPYESCNLGSINLARMTTGPLLQAQIDWELLAATVHTAVHFLDNVIDMNEFPLPEIEEMTRGNRKIGLGVMGFADLLIQMGIPYNSQDAVDVAETVMSFIVAEGRKASAALAEARGVFPNWEGSVYAAGDEPLRLRHATITTVAPTGTISIIAGASSGIEPLFAVAFTRTVMDGTQLVEVNPLFEEVAREEGFYTPDLMQEIAARGSLHDIADIPDKFKRVFATAHDVTPEWHVRIQAAFQRSTDNAVSKTVNFPNEATAEEVAWVYNLAYDLGCKGVTIYRDGCRENQVLTTGKTYEQKPAEPISPEPRARPMAVDGITRAMTTGCGRLYITINKDEHGPFEVFGNMGKAGGCASSQTEALARLISLAFRCGIKPEHIIKQLKGISCHMPAWEQGGGKILSCADAFAQAVERMLMPGDKQMAMNFNGKSFGHVGACPECGGPLVHEEGCLKCYGCGYSQCG